jgi:hypothetical protein
MKHAPIQAAGKTVAQVLRETLGVEAAASYRPSGNRPSASDIAASAHDAHMAGLISEMSAGYAAKGHRP